MSRLVGPDGKTPIKSDAPLVKYQAGGLMFETQMIPDDLLNKALQGAKQMIGGQIYAAAMKRTGSVVAAQAECNSAAAGVRDPFMLEPAAMAVFMYLSREIQFRDRVLAEVNERLVALGAEPVDLTHSHPVPGAASPEEEESDEEELASSLAPGDPDDPEEEEESTDEDRRLEGIADESAAASHDPDA
jgi:hypothetical protein